MPTLTLETAEEAFNAIVPVLKVSLSGQASLIGTAFFISSSGVLVTARHVILDNIGTDGNDLGGIGVYHPWGPLAGTYRPLRQSQWHRLADIAVCEVAQLELPTTGEIYADHVLPVSVASATPGELVSSQFFHAPSLDPDKNIPNERFNPRKSWKFSADVVFLSGGPTTPETDGTPCELVISARITQGAISDYYPDGRDRVMLPFPVYSSNLPIYPGSSGGPLFNPKGKVIAINCTRFEGTDMSFHSALSPILDFSLDKTYSPGDPSPRTRSLRELALLNFVSITGL